MPAVMSQLVFIQLFQVLAIYHDLTGSGSVQATDQVEQRAFTGSGGSHHNCEGVRGKLQVHPIQSTDEGVAHLKMLYTESCTDKRVHSRSTFEPGLADV